MIVNREMMRHRACALRPWATTADENELEQNHGT